MTMSTWKSWCAAAGVALAACAAGGRAAYYIRLDNDGMRYALVADQLRMGRGLRKPLMLNALYRSMRPDSLGTVPYTTQPPLLPMVYAALGGVRPGRLWPGQAVNLCAHLATALFSFLIARRLAGILAGAAAGIIVAVSYPLLETVGHFWTDALFIALFTAAVAMLQASRKEGRQWPFLAASGVAAACACATRFIGAALLPIFPWEGFLSWRRAGRRAAVGTILLTMPLPLMVLAMLWTRNYLITGTIRGDWLPRTGRTLGGVLRTMEAMTLEQFGLSIFGARVTLAFILLAIPAAALLGTAGGRGALKRLFADGLDLALAAILCYAGMLARALSDTQPCFESRFLSPLVPLLWVAGIALVVRGWEALGNVGLRRLAYAGIALSLILVAGSETARSWRELPRRRPSGVYGFESGSCRWVMEHRRPGSIVVTNVPCMLAFFGGVPALSPPYRQPGNPFDLLPQDDERALVRTMKRVGAEYLLLLRGIDGLPQEEWGKIRDGLPENVYGEFIARLSRPVPGEKKCGAFVKEYECPDGVVYRLAGE